MRKTIFLISVLGVSIAALWGGGWLYFAKKTNKIVIENPSIAQGIGDRDDSQMEDQSFGQVEQENGLSEKNEEQTDINDQVAAEDKTVVALEKKEPAQKNVVQEEEVGDFKIESRLVSWGFEKKADRKIDTIIIHSSYDALGSDPFSISGIIAEYKEYGVSAHYLISREGKIYQLVADKDVAYHAGESKVPDGRTGVNYFSLGIELVNTKEDEYTSVQYDALNWLLAKLKKTYEIKYVLGHKEIAPTRKTDPWGMDWNKIKR